MSTRIRTGIARPSRWAGAADPKNRQARSCSSSRTSSYITGQTLLVDGGLNLKWTHLGADNTSLFLKDESFRSAISRLKEETNDGSEGKLTSARS